MTPMEDLKRRAGTIAGDSFTTEIDTDTLQWAIAEIERLRAQNKIFRDAIIEIGLTRDAQKARLIASTAHGEVLSLNQQSGSKE